MDYGTRSYHKIVFDKSNMEIGNGIRAFINDLYDSTKYSIKSKSQVWWLIQYKNNISIVPLLNITSICIWEEVI